MYEPFTVVVHADTDALRLSLRGELDLSTVDILRNCLNGIDDGVRLVILDFADLAFLDSTGLNLLLGTQQRFGPELRELMIINPAPLIRRVLELSGVDLLIRVRDQVLDRDMAEPA